MNDTATIETQAPEIEAAEQQLPLSREHLGQINDQRAAEGLGQLIVVGEYIVDPETGEVFGLLDEPQEFGVRDEESFDWVARKMLAANAELVAVDHEPDVLYAKTILANAEAKKARIGRRLAWLHTRFDAEMAEYAREQLAGRKERTYRSLVGMVSFRVTPESLKVADHGQAVAWAKEHEPEAVRTVEEFLISLLPKERKAALLAALRAYQEEVAAWALGETGDPSNDDPDVPCPTHPAPAFAYVPAGEQVTVDAPLADLKPSTRSRK